MDGCGSKSMRGKLGLYQPSLHGLTCTKGAGASSRDGFTCPILECLFGICLDFGKVHLEFGGCKRM
jgi:hypothetical protein